MSSENSENSKGNILNTACTLFSQKGYDAVGVQEICEKSGITKPTLYYFFGSKKGLLQALTLQTGGQLLENLTKACIYRHDFSGSVTEILKTEIAFARQNPEYFRLHVNLMNAPENSEGAECYAQLKTQLNKTLLDFFTFSSQEFGNMHGKEQLYSTLFHNNLITIASDVLSGILTDSEEAVYTIIHSLLYGFAN